MATQPVFRFAPSPNGNLHLGHAYSALYTEQAAAEVNGRVLLRIEDIDFTRCRPEYVANCLEDLRWLGFRWHGEPRIQSRHLDLYHDALDRLRAMGLLYPCFASRQEIRNALVNRPDWPQDPDGAPIYPGLHKQLTDREVADFQASGLPAAWRLDMEKALQRIPRPITFTELGSGTSGESGRLEAHPERWGDVVLGRKDIGVSYHIAVVVDDALQGVTHVTRGQDLFHATGIHRLLQILLGLPEPLYCHHRLISDETGRKLSKSLGDRSLRSLREEGVTADQIRTRLGFPPIADDQRPSPQSASE